MPNHYVYNREGASLALGLSSVNQVKRYIDNALKAGLQPSKIIGGIEMFDISILLNTHNNKSPANSHGYKASQLKCFAGGTLF